MKRRWFWLLLALPILAVIYPPAYNRLAPELFGLPFFYWYLLLWTVLCGVVCALVLGLIRGGDVE